MSSSPGKADRAAVPAVNLCTRVATNATCTPQIRFSGKHSKFGSSKNSFRHSKNITAIDLKFFELIYLTTAPRRGETTSHRQRAYRVSNGKCQIAPSRTKSLLKHTAIPITRSPNGMRVSNYLLRKGMHCLAQGRQGGRTSQWCCAGHSSTQCSSAFWMAPLGVNRLMMGLLADNRLERLVAHNIFEFAFVLCSAWCRDFGKSWQV